MRTPFVYPVADVQLKLIGPGGVLLRQVDLTGTLDPEHVIAMLSNAVREEYEKAAE
jgi:hypothetical protein